MPRLRPITFLTSLLFLLLLPIAHAEKPPLTLDEFFNAVEIRSVQISPDGHVVVIETVRPDWAANRFRNDLWLYRDDNGGSLVQLTQSGHDSSPQWSPDGRWIAFLSNREKNDVAQVYVISISGSQAFPVTLGDEGIHAFAWSEDSRRLYFAIRTAQRKARKNAEEWKDVVRFRESDSGDTVFSVDLTFVVAKDRVLTGQRVSVLPVQESFATTPYRVQQMATSPDGRSLALATVSPSGRFETHEPYGIYVADLPAGTLHLAVHTKAEVDEIHWAKDSRHVFFTYSSGTPEGAYETSQQTRLYSVGAGGGTAERWVPHFTGAIASWAAPGAFAITQNGATLAAGKLRTEAQPYIGSSADTDFVKLPAWSGTYEALSAGRHSPRIAFVYSSLQRPPEVYLADSPERFQQARAITAFNNLLAERELPRGKPYRWTADDGTSVEGMLIYPPGKYEAKHLPMFTLIHGGFGGVVGNCFYGSWWWAALAATRGWLVFEPNFRGSIGYGDDFASGKMPHVLSRPGKDILEGVDALVKEGIADPDQLTVGGYSYGGMITNWLVTRTTRFKAAVTGAGAVEWVGFWGNSVGQLWGVSLLGGVPWEAEANYNAEGAIWQMGKITTPTHIVVGSEDTEVPAAQAYMLERALQTTGIPHALLIFPGEGHDLDNNPWHGKIKVRQELKWLEKYGRKKQSVHAGSHEDAEQ